MTWFRDPYGHIIESKNKTHRLVYLFVVPEISEQIRLHKIKSE